MPAGDLALLFQTSDRVSDVWVPPPRPSQEAWLLQDGSSDNSFPHLRHCRLVP